MSDHWLVDAAEYSIALAVAAKVAKPKQIRVKRSMSDEYAAVSLPLMPQKSCLILHICLI